MKIVIGGGGLGEQNVYQNSIGSVKNEINQSIFKYIIKTKILSGDRTVARTYKGLQGIGTILY